VGNDKPPGGALAMKFLNLAKKIGNSWLFQKFNYLRSLASFIYRQFLRITAGNRGIPVNIGGAGTFKLDYQVASGELEDWGKGHNQGFTKCIESCQGKSVVLDIGAHVGFYSLPISKVLALGGLVYAFEPATANFKCFQKHLKYNEVQNVKLFPYLVGEESKEQVDFYERANLVDGMCAKILKKNAHLYNKVSKRQVSMDDFCRQNKLIPEVVKIDVEGAELEVMQGAEEILKEHHPLIFLSVHPRHLAAQNTSLNDLEQAIANLGYSLCDMEGEKPANLSNLQEYLLIP